MTHGRLEWLRPSAIEGIWRLKIESPEVGILDTQAAAKLLATTYRTAGVDLTIASQILEAFPNIDGDKAALYRQVFKQVLATVRPPLLGLLIRGRIPFYEALDDDAAECFRRCGALDGAPAREIVEWLDNLANLARGQVDIELTEVGRAAERLSYDYEVRRLAHIPGAPPVEWVALNDNAAGFDIRSSNHLDGRFIPHLIEVKACSSNRLEFYLTRKEWETARRAPASYTLHLWRVTSLELTQVPWLQLAPHLPSDTPAGHWMEARIKWPPATS